LSCACSALVGAAARHFDEAKARQELESYRKNGPQITTRGLLGLLVGSEPLPETVLDIGSGIGALSLELLRAGVQRAMCVDLSAATLAANGEEAQRQGVADRIERVEGDFAAIAAMVPSADLVALDRVVCCYPAYAPLLEQAAGHSHRLLAMSYPRNRWWVHLALWVENAWRRIRGNRFKAFVHSPAAMTSLLRAHGFAPARTATTFTWQMDLYVRKAAITP
jgi:magnesium-protoporphyrin O-methyltransferase